MGSDDLFKKRKGQRKQRKENNLKMAPYRYLIVCEGQETEKNYFEGIRKRIDARYPGSVKVEEKVELNVKGIGRNTESLVKYTTEYVNRSNVSYGQIWVIFDKDNFSDEQFNDAIHEADNKGYGVGWSNEAFELWFLLHFEYLCSAINRDQYCDKLTKHFGKAGINNGKYEKNLENIFELLMEYGDFKQAIEWAKLLLEMHREAGNNNSEAKMKPATKVFNLVKELSEYF